MPRRLSLKSVASKVNQARSDHAERHRATGLQFALADDIDFLNSAAWDQVTRDASIFMSRDYLRALRDAGPKEISSRLCLIFQQGQPLAALACQRLTLSGQRLVGNSDDGQRGDSDGEETRHGLRQRARRLLSNVGRRAAGGMTRRILLCGNLLSWGNHGLAFADGAEEQRLWPAVAEALYRLRSAERLVGKTDYLLIKDLPAAKSQSHAALRRFSYRCVETDPDMVLEIATSWRHFDDYLASLTSKYRGSARKIASTIEAAGWRLEQLSDLAPVADPLWRLYLNVHQRAAVKPVTAPATYLPALAQALGPTRFRCTVLRRGDELAGFVTSIKDRDMSVGYLIGLDYRVNEELPVYFRLLQATIADAIALGCRRLSLGRTALEPKAKLGAKPVPLTVWLRHRHPLKNLVIRPVLSAIAHNEAPERHVMKEVE